MLMQCAPAHPYFSVSESLMKPRRPREVICELLACGIPLSPTAHTSSLLPPTSLMSPTECKVFVRAAKKLVAHARAKGPMFDSHVAVAVDQGLLSGAQMAYVHEARAAVHAVNNALAPGALNSVVRSFHWALRSLNIQYTPNPSNSF